MLKKILLGVTLTFLTPSIAYGDPKLPERGIAPVVDAAHVMSPDTVRSLSVRLTAWEKKTHHQLVVVTVPDLQGYPISDYGYQLGRKWRLGRTGIDDGIILLRAVKEKRTRIEVGSGLEVALPDAEAINLLKGTIVPTIKTKGIDAGLVAGADAIMQEIDAHETDVKTKVTTPSQGNPLLVWILGLLTLCFFAVFGFIMVRRSRRKSENTPSTDKDPITNFKPLSVENFEREYNQKYPVRTQPRIAPEVADTPYIPPIIEIDTDSYYTRRQDESSDDSSDNSFDIGFSSDNDDDSSFLGGGADIGDDD